MTTELSYRTDLQNLLENLLPDLYVTHEPTRSKCGAPDYIITNKGIPVGYVEAKDIDENLHSKSFKEQFSRYKRSLDNIVFTNYREFEFYKRGELIASINLANIADNKVIGISSAFSHFEKQIKDFSQVVTQSIKSPKQLAEMMATKANLLAQVIESALNQDEEENSSVHEAANNSLHEQLTAFKNILIHDIKHKEFADIYAQTIAYGMFAARLHDPTMDTFTRQEAAELIPKSNPFLRKLFQYIAGYDLDKRIVWIVDALADIFRATDVASLLKTFGKSTQQNDPIIHFYETFLSEYDPNLRKSRGVWYTPEPVVKFIVKAVDDILKSEFDLSGGLGDTAKTKIKTKVFTKATADQRSKVKESVVEQEVHKVQVLDP